DDFLGAFDHVVLHADDKRRPFLAMVDTVGPVLAHPVELGTHRLDKERHLGGRVLHLRVICERAAERQGCAPLGRFDGEVARPQSDRVVNARETGERYPEEGEDELVDAAGGQDAGDVLIRYEGALENGVVAARGPHAERIPGLLDPVAGSIAWQEPMDYPRVC